MHCFVIATIASMPAGKELVAASPCLLFAFTFRTMVQPRIFKYSLTKSALLGILIFFVLSASFANMVRFGSATDTKVIPALWTTNSICAHVLRSNFIDELAFIVLILVVHIALHEFNCIATLASDHIFVFLKHSVQNLCLELVILFRSKYLSDLVIW